MRFAIAACCLALTGCSRYSDFTLPLLPGPAGSGCVEVECAAQLR